MCILLIGPRLNGNKRIGQLIRSPSTYTISLSDSESCRVHEVNVFTTSKNHFPVMNVGLTFNGSLCLPSSMELHV